jgi:molecular chaperone GrpE
VSARDKSRAESKSQPSEKAEKAEKTENTEMSRSAEQESPDEGWESMVEEESEGALAENPELEAALQEAAAAIDESGRVAEVAAVAAVAEEGVADAGTQVETGAREGEPKLERSELELAQDRLVRLQADFENFRRRAMKERTEVQQYGHQNLIKDLLSTVDNLDRAIDHARGATDSGSGGLESLLQGVELVQRELVGVMARHGVSETEALGKPFDPALHEAMAQSPNDSVPANTIVEVLEKGYQLRGRLVRPSRVIVAQPSEDKDQVDENEQNGEGRTTD